MPPPQSQYITGVYSLYTKKTHIYFFRTITIRTSAAPLDYIYSQVHRVVVGFLDNYIVPLVVAVVAVSMSPTTEAVVRYLPHSSLKNENLIVQ